MPDKVVGRDFFGNTYYIRRGLFHGRGGVRKVKYVRGVRDAACIPPKWDLWLRGTIDEIPESCEKASDGMAYYGNLSGSAFTNLPPGHALKRQRTLYKSYQKWVP